MQIGGMDCKENVKIAAREKKNKLKTTAAEKENKRIKVDSKKVNTVASEDEISEDAESETDHSFEPRLRGIYRNRITDVLMKSKK